MQRTIDNFTAKNWIENSILFGLVINTCTLYPYINVYYKTSTNQNTCINKIYTRENDGDKSSFWSLSEFKGIHIYGVI